MNTSLTKMQGILPDLFYASTLCLLLSAARKRTTPCVLIQDAMPAMSIHFDAVPKAPVTASRGASEVAPRSNACDTAGHSEASPPKTRPYRSRGGMLSKKAAAEDDNEETEEEARV